MFYTDIIRASRTNSKHDSRLSFLNTILSQIVDILILLERITFLFFFFMCSVSPVPSPLNFLIRITLLWERPSTELEDRLVTRDLSTVMSHHCQGGTMGLPQPSVTEERGKTDKQERYKV